MLFQNLLKPRERFLFISMENNQVLQSYTHTFTVLSVTPDSLIHLQSKYSVYNTGPDKASRSPGVSCQAAAACGLPGQALGSLPPSSKPSKPWESRLPAGLLGLLSPLFSKGLRNAALSLTFAEAGT